MDPLHGYAVIGIGMIGFTAVVCIGLLAAWGQRPPGELVTVAVGSVTGLAGYLAQRTSREKGP